MQWQRELLLISNLIEYLNYGKGKKQFYETIDIKNNNNNNDVIDSSNSNDISNNINSKKGTVRSKSKSHELTLPIIGFISNRMLSDSKKAEKDQIISSSKDNLQDKSKFQVKKKILRRLDKIEDNREERRNVENVGKPKFSSYVYFNWGQKLKA